MLHPHRVLTARPPATSPESGAMDWLLFAHYLEGTQVAFYLLCCVFCSLVFVVFACLLPRFECFSC